MPDGRWFGSRPEVIFAADGAEAERMLPRIRDTIATYRYAAIGDYRLWPGPNSNTFVAAVMSAVPEMRASLPATAIGKDFPYDGRWIGGTPSGTGFRINLGGYCGVTVAWVEGIEVNLLGAVAGIDLRRPGLKLPGLGARRVLRDSAAPRTDPAVTGSRPFRRRSAPAPQGSDRPSAYSVIAAAFETLRLRIAPANGIFASTSQQLRVRSRRPLPSAPSTMTRGGEA